MNDKSEEDEVSKNKKNGRLLCCLTDRGKEVETELNRNPIQKPSSTTTTMTATAAPSTSSRSSSSRSSGSSNAFGSAEEDEVSRTAVVPRLRHRKVGGPLLGSSRGGGRGGGPLSLTDQMMAHTTTSTSSSGPSGSLGAPPAQSPPTESMFLDSWTTFPPLLTESLVLLPSETSVTVLSAATSRLLGHLQVLPSPGDDTDNAEQTAAGEDEPGGASADDAESEVVAQKIADVNPDAVAATEGDPRSPGTQPVSAPAAKVRQPPTTIAAAIVFQGQAWIGLSDGALLEFALDDDNNEAWKQPSRTRVTGKAKPQQWKHQPPRRTVVLPALRQLIRLAGDGEARLLHLALVEAGKDGSAIAYVLLAGSEFGDENHNKKKQGKSTVATEHLYLLRFAIPAWAGMEGAASTGIPTPNTQIVTLTETDLHIVDKWEYPLSDSAQKYPFDLLAARSNSRSRSSITVLVLVATPSALTVYGDNDPTTDHPSAPTTLLSDQRPMTIPKVAFHHPGRRSKQPPHKLSAAALAPDNDTVALGYWNGEVLVYPHLLSHVHLYMGQVEQYWTNRKAQPPQSAEEDQHSRARKPTHPLNGLASQRLHWHAHPVRALAFGEDARRLYSGGEESVLVVWELDRADPKSAVLPRLGLGAIVHVALPRRLGGDASSASHSLLVHCGDNSLQLLLAHNLARVWKYDGLAATPIESSGRSNVPTNTHLPLWIDCDTATLWLTGLPRAPGRLQGWDAALHRVQDTAVVVPYNRVSRVDWDDPPMPEPRVILACADARSTTLATVDHVPTENSGIGRAPFSDGGDEGGGGVTTLRFWRRRASRSPAGRPPFELVAAVAFPHGSTHDVSSLALSSCGRYACTVSNTERSWRLWSRRGVGYNEFNEERPTGGGSEWTCLYKVDLPAGYANYGVPPRGADFSSDSTILAMAHGPYIAMWDFADNARLVGSLTHFDPPPGAKQSLPPRQHPGIQSLQFVSNASMILTTSRESVKLQSPYGTRGPRGWTYHRRKQRGYEDWTVAAATPLEGFVAIALNGRQGGGQTSQVVLLEWLTGVPVTALQLPAGNLVSMTSFPPPSFGWVDADDKVPAKPNAPSIRIFVVDSHGVLSLLESAPELGSPTAPPLIQDEMPYFESLVPKTPLLSALPQRRPATKRRLAVLDEEERGDAIQDQSSAQAVAALLSPPSLAETPHLGTAFVRAFVMRHLKG